VTGAAAHHDGGDIDNVGQVEKVESDYYAFMAFDRANAESVLSHYPPFFPDGPVLELACGPGVFLDLLAAKGVRCSGVDIDDGMVAECRAKGHHVVLDDALNHLAGVADSSLNGLFAAHFLEHLPSEVVQRVYAEAARVLAPGGVFVAVVPNAACHSILAHDFWRDPTHVRFYDPVLLQFFAQQAGLSLVESGGNPRNHPGPPPGLLPHAGQCDIGDLREDIGETIKAAEHQLQAAGRHRFGPDDPTAAATAEILGRIGHFLWVLNKQSTALAQQVEALRAANSELVAQLYPPNEVYVVVRKGAGE
jgi:SAM-dependent methyltransferase